MPDKEFEQQVREGLQDWEIQPNPEIRKAVLKAIRRRKRRGFFLWVPVGLLSLGGMLWGGWYVFEGGKTGANIVSTVAPAENHSVSAPSGNRAAPVTTTPAGAAATLKAPAGARAATATPAGAHATTAVPGTSVTATPGVTVSELPARSTRGATYGAEGHAGAGANGANAATQGETAAGAPLGEATAPPPGDLTKAPGGTALTRKFDTHAARLTPEQINRGKSTKTNHWTFHLYGNAGWSGQGPFLQFHTPTESRFVHYVQSPGANYSSSPGSTLGGTGYGYDTLAARKTGAGWSLGVSASRQLSKHLRLDMGVAFDQLETRLGPVEKTSYGSFLAAQAYGATTSISSPAGSTVNGKDFVNRYQLLRLPLNLAWTVAPSARWTPTVSVGFSPAYLFTGNALMYTPDGEGYQTNKLLYRHLSLYGDVGATMDLWRSRWCTLEAGPFMQYGFSGIQKATPVKDHLNYAGLRVGIALPSTSRKP
jgi:hypothetical protein